MQKSESNRIIEAPSELQQLIQDRVPTPFTNVIVKCGDYSCLAYLNTKGDWISVFSHERLPDVAGWMPLTFSKSNFRMADFFYCQEMVKESTGSCSSN